MLNFRRSYVPPSSLGQQRGPRVRMVPTTSIPRPTFPSLFDPEIQGNYSLLNILGYRLKYSLMFMTVVCENAP